MQNMLPRPSYFKVNDKVVHPQYGGGHVDGIESIQVGGEAIECLKIRCVSKDRKIFVPRGSEELAAIRPPMSTGRFRQLRKTLTAAPEELHRNFNRRMKQVKSKLESGDPLQIGEVLRDLYPRWAVNSLSTSDQRIFEKTRDLLVSEIALIRDSSYDEAGAYLDKTMKGAKNGTKTMATAKNGAPRRV